MYRICALFLSVTILGICKGARDSIVEKCLRKCDTAFDTLDGRGNLFCDKDCRQHECQTGCGYYEESINSSCKSVCDKPNSRDARSFEELTSQTKIQNCVRGCNIALGIYVQDARKKLGYLPRPELNRKSKNYSSVEIKWTGNFLPNVTYLVHKRILDSNTEGNWHFHNSTQRHNSGFLITNLHPYVTYQFKIVVVISKTYLAESNYSVPITTLAHGVPASAPRITGLSAPSPTVITMSWRPPVFPNGPLLGYRINLNPKGNEDLKEVTKEVPSNATSWTLGQLQSSQLYIVSLSAWNAAGEGPASQGSATTLNPVTINETPFLILGADTKVCKQNIHNIIDIPNKLYRSHSNITGVGIHRKRELIVVSDATGKVHLIPIGNSNEERRLNMYPSILKPTTISIDWLNDRVFIISRNRIYSCPLYSDNDECLVVIEGLKSSASDVKVDPLNGYMYYSDMGPGRGIFRVDLADIGKSGKIKQKQMVNYDKVTSFTMDFSNMQLYYPNATANTMMACYFDGSDVQNIRTNVMQGDFSNMLSLTSYKGLFYWTTGDSVMREAYDSSHKTYRQNNMLFFDNQYSGLNIYHPAVQPTPVPFMAPTGIQALFDSMSVQISWTPPEKLQYQGHGAWNKWDYSIEIYSSESNSALPVKTKRAVKESHISVNHLKPDTGYSIRIKALSDTGDGPWSDFFIGRTLKQESIPVKIYLSTNGAIMERDLREQKPHNITYSTYHNVTDMTWYEDDVIWITTAGDLFVYNRTEGIDYQNRQARIASCVAFDWLGKKIFWSEPDKNVVMKHGKTIELYKQRRGLWVDGVIRRSDLRGITSDSIYQTAARDMAIDSIAGRIYWATVNTIESTYLNGEGHTQIFMIPFFSGKHVISLTVNHDLQKVMWYVKSYENQDLYVADLVGLNGADISVASSTVRRIGGFNNIYRSSGLQYYSHHLFWLDESESLVVGDQMGNYSSLISPVTDYVSAFTVIHPSLQPYPAGKNSTNLVVVPHPMAASDITVVGHWSKFNLTWRSSTEVNHGQVYYKVYIQIRHKAYHKITKETSIPREGISPYTQMTVTIQPYTYWGYADSTTVPIRSPMSVPGKPLTPRVYVMQHKNATTAKQSMAADFRWSTPEFINGILQHHYVYHWEKGARNVTILRLPGTARHFTLNPLKSNKTYFFQVEACTEVGCGERSEIVSAKTDAVNPVPRLLIATKMSVLLSEMDEHRNSSVLLSDISPLAMAFLAQDERTFWIDQDTSLFVAKGSEKSRLMNLKSRGKDLTMDWISRTLYVVEEGTNNRNRIMGYQVDQENYITIVDRGSNIGSIVSDPYSSSLFWTEIDGQGNGNLYKSCLNGSNVVAVFGKMASRSRRSLPDHCSCRTNLNIAPVISMDYTEKGATEVVVVDKDSQTVLATDVDGCFCRDLFKPTQSNDHGLPPDLLAIDHTRVYWYNKDEGLLYSIDKKTGQTLPTLDLPDTKDLVAYGVHLQPLPDSACLDPGAYNGTVEAIKITNTSVTLRLEEVKRPEQCRGISLPRDKFTIYYSKDEHSVRKAQTDCGSKDDSCLSVESYNKEVRIDRLEVYTNYVFQVAVSNYYTEYLAEAVGKQVRFATLHGAPSEPRHVSLNELSPYAVSVRWLPPLKSNGPEENISYVAMWNTTNENGVMLEGKTDRSEVLMKKSGYLTADIGNLLPNHPYSVKVLAYDYTGEFYTESPAYQIQTCQEPNDIDLYEVSNDTIAVTWTSPTDGCVRRHSISCITYETKEDNYDGFNLYHTVNNTMYMVNFTNLKPNTKYNFKVNLVFKSLEMLKWPEEDRCMFKTLTGIPEKPEPPFVKVLKTETHEIVWESPKDRGAPIDYFLLEYSQIDTLNWTTLYNGSEQRWHVDLEKFTPSFSYVFRVAAHNKNGFGLSSDNSSVFAAPLMAKSTMNDTITIAVAVVVIVVTCIIIIAIVMCILIRKRQLEKSAARQFVAIRGPDVELATLRDLPHTAVQQSNTLYAFSIVPTDDDIAALPYFRRDQLVLTRFLGSGAFGEVFEGVAKNITDNPGETRVAVKTLRKSASEQEKEEFLKEALLMSNFKHEHILSLLGVCLDNDPQFIIMELMEGGDLLSYLRCCRATISSPPRLFLPDLIRVCVNVAAGCEYLEGMHFVHRDLAARNCLVSSKNPTEMIVKIGDFGLARDIYKNDYYRKEGEGLLPVRWMSPESLVDGVFTTPSDIWAFGVLMWEVITLGQQPYPARTNVEVLHFVRSGGKLDKPDKCPQEIYNLMENCWSFSPQERPSFASISLELKQIQQKCATMSPEEIIQSSPTADAGIEGTTSPTEEVSTHDKKFIPSEHSLSTLTGGGSVRLTPTSKKRRLRNLMGGAEQSNEKLVVDLSTAGRIKRTVSFDATHSNGHVSYSPVINPHDFNQFDQFGYLNPRAKNTPHYLTLLNHAPELEDYGLDSHQTSQTMRTDPHYNYNHISPYHEIPRSRHHSSSSNPPPYSMVRSESTGNPRSPRPSCSSDEAPYYHTNNIDSHREIEPRLSTGSWPANHPDRDIYSSPVFNGNVCESPPHSPGYCADCHNNVSNTEMTVPFYLPVQDAGTCNRKPDKPVWANNNSDKVYNACNNGCKVNSGPPNPEYINYHSGGRSRAQVFPEPGTALAGFDISQASLV